MENNDIFKLSKVLQAHNNQIRCMFVKDNYLVTGSYDKSVKLYYIDENNNITELVKIDFFEEMVYSVKINENNTHIYFGTNSKIYEVDFQGNPTFVYEGQNGIIDSIDILDNKMATGSWSGVVVLWDIITKQKIKSFEGENYSVAVALNNNFLYTGHQNGKLKKWNVDNGQVINVIEKAHNDLIRKVRFFKNKIYTTSNDGSVKVWNDNLGLLNNYDWSNTFLFGSDVNPNYLICGGEDFNVYIGKNENENYKLVQKIQCPGTIWQTNFIDNENFITGNFDGSIKIFTSNSKLYADKITIESFENEINTLVEKQKANNSVSQEQLDKFPFIEQKNQFIGKKNGEVKVFKDNNVPKVYQWNDNDWVYVGEMMGVNNNKKNFYHGDSLFEAGEYDYVFDVEVQQGIFLKLPYNNNENPLVAAEKFIARENISTTFKEQICGFIQKNAKVTFGQENLNNQNNQVNNIYANPIQKKEKFFYSQMNLDGFIKKFKEINENLEKENSNFFLTKSELLQFEKFIENLKYQDKYYLTKEFTYTEDKVLKTKLINWENKYFLPIADLLRFICNHHASQILFNGVSSLSNTLIYLISNSSNTQPKHIMLSLKFLSNLMKYNYFNFEKNTNLVFDFLNKIHPNLDLNNIKLLINFLMNLISTSLENSRENNWIKINHWNTIINYIINYYINLENWKNLDVELLKLLVIILNLKSINYSLDQSKIEVFKNKVKQLNKANMNEFLNYL